MQITRKKLSVALIGAFGTSFLFATSNAGAQQVQRVEKIEVTGTNIKRTDTETPSVVQVITREQIEKSGASSVAELLRQVPAIAGGNVIDFDRGTGFNSGNATASLRGLGSVATLVLLNGRRIAAAPVADPNSGQGTAYNLSSIPLSAIERIDILKDGASAIYGSDAIAGVINIILRKDFRGGEITWNHWQKLDQFSDMNYRSEQLSGTIGFGDLAKDRYNVVVSAEWYKREPVWVRDSGSGIQNDLYRTLNGRDVPNGSAITSPPNYRRESPAGTGLYPASGRLAVDPRCPTDNRVAISAAISECRTNQFDYAQVVSESERGGIMGRGTLQLTSNMTGFLEASFSRVDSTFVFSPPTLDAAAPVTWFNRAGQRFTYTLALPPGHPDNPNNFNVGLRYRFVDLGIPEQSITQDAGRVVAGINGTTGAWDWETAVMYASNQTSSSRNDRLYLPALTSAVNTGAYRFGSASNPQALLDALHPAFTQDGDSKVTSWDLKGSRDVWNLPAGPVSLAAGIEARHEEMTLTTDPRVVAGDFVGIASSGMDGARTVWSLYGELSIPILKNLEATAALRTDHYSDFGYANTPKFGFKWNATESLAARGTWAKGFRAPSLFQNSTAQVQAFLNNTVDPVRCPNGVGGALPPGAETVDCAVSLSALISANRSLEPETSTSNSLGFIWAPSTDFSLSVDRWYVRRENFIDIFDAATVLRNENNPNFAGGAVIRNPNPASWLPGVPNSGPLQSILLGFGNFGAHATAGYDIDIAGKWSMGAWGRLRVDANATYTDKYQVQLFKDSAYISALGNFFWIAPVPRFKSVVTGIWESGPFQFLGRYNYTGGFDDGQPSDDGTQTNAFSCYRSAAIVAAYGGECRVSSWETWDVGVSWEGIKNLKLSALVRNVTNVPAPYFATTNSNTTTIGYYPQMYNPYGRYLQLSVTYKFK